MPHQLRTDSKRYAFKTRLCEQAKKHGRGEHNWDTFLPVTVSHGCCCLSAVAAAENLACPIWPCQNVIDHNSINGPTVSCHRMVVQVEKVEWVNGQQTLPVMMMMLTISHQISAALFFRMPNCI